jgi:hypothetical protein
MTHDWFVIRDSKERGPFTAQQLKDMARKGDLAPDDLVRRADMQAPRKASAIKGLFAPVDPAPAKPSPPPATATAPPAAQKKGVPSKKALIIASVVGGACLFLCCGGLGVLAIFGHKMSQQLNKELDEADALWDSGEKDEAIAIYREKRQSAFLDSSNPRSPVVYGRLIDYEYEKGNGDAGKALIEEGDKKKITPAVSHADAKTALATVQAERKKREEQEKARARGKVLTAEFYPYKKGMVHHTMKVLYVPNDLKLRSQLREEYRHEGDGVITIRCLEHFTVPGYRNLPLLPQSKRYYREKDGFIEIGSKPTEDFDIVWDRVVKLGAVAGDEWEDKANEMMTQRYKLVKFATDEVLLKSLKPGEKQDKYLIAFLERHTKVTTGDGKVMENVEEFGLAKGIGPVNWRSFRIEDGRRIENWHENVTPVIKQ